MEVTINTLSGVAQEAEIEVSDAELRPIFEEAYHKYREKAELKGFRKGKVPMEMIRRLYGEAIEQDSLDNVADEFYRRVMQEKNIRPIGRPAMTDMDYRRGERFRFKIKYEVRPAIELHRYKGIAVEKPVHKVEDAEVQAELDRIRRLNAVQSEVPSVTDANHVVTADVQELDNTGTPLIGKKTANARFDLSDETLVREIREALTHAETGGVYRATFESKHGDHAYTVHAAITATKVEKTLLPDFDDAFVKKITGDKIGTTGEFLTDLRADLERYWAEKSDRAVNDAIAAELMRLHEFPVPDSLVGVFLDSFVEDIRSKTRDKRLPKDFDEEKFRAESRAYAIWQARWMLLKERIAEEENLTVTDDELERLSATEAARIGVEKERLLQYYKDSGSASERLLSGKLMAFLKENAAITEKAVAEAPQE